MRPPGPASVSLALLGARALPALLVLLPAGAFELQDTIHELIEENIRLHDRLENLTQVLGKLRHMLWQRSDEATHHNHHGDDFQHLWEEWSQLGVSAETHVLLEHALCGRDPHGSAWALHGGPGLVLVALTTACLSLLLR